MIQDYEVVSGKKVNFPKSSILFAKIVSEKDHADMAGLLRMPLSDGGWK